jgi:hypothetical protein
MLAEAQNDLQTCGLFLDQPEGWGYFTGREARRVRRDFGVLGDGHTAMSVQSMKQGEDDTFTYKFSWPELGDQKGWVIHYRSKHGPLSAELESVFRYFKLNRFDECPEFDFEECHWRSIAFVEHGDGFFDTNAEVAHRSFDAHALRFSPGIRKLLARYYVIFVSKEYADRVWTNHESQSAQARALTEKGKDYILPIKVDEAELAIEVIDFYTCAVQQSKD